MYGQRSGFTYRYWKKQIIYSVTYSCPITWLSRILGKKTAWGMGFWKFHRVSMFEFLWRQWPNRSKLLWWGRRQQLISVISAWRTGWCSRSGDLIQLFLADGSIPWATTRKVEVHHRSNPIRSCLSCYLSFGSLSQGFLIGASLRSVNPKLRQGRHRWCVWIGHTAPTGNDALHFLNGPLLDNQHISDRDQLSLASVSVRGFSWDDHSSLTPFTIFSFSDPSL